MYIQYMTTKIQKWGNSLAVRLPKEVARKLTLQEGSEVVDDVRTAARSETSECLHVHCVSAGVKDTARKESRVGEFERQGATPGVKIQVGRVQTLYHNGFLRRQH